jgi:hypothetical protein
MSGTEMPPPQKNWSKTQGTEGTFARNLTESRKVRDKLLDQDPDEKYITWSIEHSLQILISCYMYVSIKKYCLDCIVISANNL